MDLSSIEDELLTCGLCEELVFTEERNLHMLPCQHSLCTECVQELNKKKNQNVALSCPWCRNDIVIDKDENPPIHRFAEKLSKLIKNVQVEKDVEIPSEKLEEVLDGYPKIVQRFDLQKHLSRTEVGKVAIESSRIYMVYPDVAGIICYDVVGNMGAQKISNGEAMYGDICLIDDELYAYNMTEGLIEVYKDLILFRHWKPTLPAPLFEKQKYLFCFLSQLQLVAASMGLFLISYQSCWLFTKSGRFIEITHPMKRNDLETWKQLLNPKTDISFHGCSLWIYSKEDNYLFQVPMKQLNSRQVKIGAPIRHCRISGYKCSYGIDESMLLYCTNGEPDIVKVIDLDSITKAFDIPYKHAQKRAYKDAARGRNYLRTVGVGEVTQISMNATGSYISLVESKALIIYQMKPVADSPTPASNDQPTQTDNTITHFTTGQSSQTEDNITLYTEDHRPVDHFTQTEDNITLYTEDHRPVDHFTQTEDNITLCTEDHHPVDHFTQTDEQQLTARELSVLVSKKCVFKSLMMKFFKLPAKCLSRGGVEFYYMIQGFLALICILVVIYRNK